MTVKVFVKITRNKKTLLVKKSNQKYHRKWYLPGGPVLEGESLAESAMRSTKETTGYDIALNGIFYIHFINRPASERGLYIYYTGRILDGRMKTETDDRSIDCGWYDQKGTEELELWNNLPTLLMMDNVPLISTSQLIIEQR
jgi:ADP-ribose pyrophosphatase YjhB (NUDIX family)